MAGVLDIRNGRSVGAAGIRRLGNFTVAARGPATRLCRKPFGDPACSAAVDKYFPHFGGGRLCVYVCGASVAVAVAVSLCVAVSATIELAGCMADQIFVGRWG